MPLTASRSSTSSATVLSIRRCENSLMSKPGTIAVRGELAGHPGAAVDALGQPPQHRPCEEGTDQLRGDVGAEVADLVEPP